LSTHTVTINNLLGYNHPVATLAAKIARLTGSAHCQPRKSYAVLAVIMGAANYKAEGAESCSLGGKMVR